MYSNRRHEVHFSSIRYSSVVDVDVAVAVALIVVAAAAAGGGGLFRHPRGDTSKLNVGRITHSSSSSSTVRCGSR